LSRQRRSGSIDAVAADGSPSTLPLPTGPGRATWRHVAIIAGAVVAGLLLNHLLQDHLAALQELAATDPLAARRRLATEFRIGGIGLFLLTGALGASLIAAARRARRDERFPPEGVWGWGARRTLTGAPARRAAVVGVVLGAALLVCSVAGAALSWEIGTRLLACRAGVLPPEATIPVHAAEI
jgi:hypothetical protein